MEEMRTVPAPYAGDPAGYALGVVRYRWFASRNADLFSHGGGGFGFLSDLWWSPPLQVGVAVLTNSADHHLQGDLALSILRDLVHEPGSVYEDRLLALPAQAPFADPDGGYRPPAGMADLVSSAGMRPIGDEAARWARYAGTYRTPDQGYLNPMRSPQRFLVESGVPYFDADTSSGSLVRHRLTEIQPGLFLAENGETLDFSGSPPTWRNLDLVRVTGGPATWQWGLLGVVAVVAIWWLIGAVVATVRRRRSAALGAGEQPTTQPRMRLLAAAVATLTAILALAAIAVIVAVPALVEAGFLGWLELPLAERLVLHVPLALAVSGIGLVALGTIGWVRRWWSSSVLRRYVALAAASAALVVQLAAWGLIGWGLT
jgi:hypothetical protein